MTTSMNDTLLLGAPVVRSAATPAPDRTRELMRIVRHALKGGAGDSPLDRAIRAAPRAADTGGGRDSEDDDVRCRLVAGRMNALLARRAVAHRETVRA